MTGKQKCARSILRKMSNEDPRAVFKYVTDYGSSGFILGYDNLTPDFVNMALNIPNLGFNSKITLSSIEEYIKHHEQQDSKEDTQKG